MGGLRVQSQVSSDSSKPLSSCLDELIPPYFEKLLPYNGNAQYQEAETCPSRKLRAPNQRAPVATCTLAAFTAPTPLGCGQARAPEV